MHSFDKYSPYKNEHNKCQARVQFSAAVLQLYFSLGRPYFHKTSSQFSKLSTDFKTKKCHGSSKHETGKLRIPLLLELCKYGLIFRMMSMP
jgi:hypothetical protein